jgi:hypothetical protein
VRGPALLFAGLLVTPLLGGPQNPDACASPSENENEITLRAESWDPVVTIGRTLSDRYGINVSVEAPKWAFPDDTEDVAVADPAFSEQHNNIHYDVMKRHALEVRFSTSGSDDPIDVPRLLRQVVEAANKEMPYGYRLDVNGNVYALVPTTTRNSKGDLEDVLPLLDRKVTIPLATRSIAEHANLMADEPASRRSCTSVVVSRTWPVFRGVWPRSSLELTASLPAKY